MSFELTVLPTGTVGLTGFGFENANLCDPTGCEISDI